MYTSQNNKALHHAVGSPMNPHRMVVLSHLTCDQAIFFFLGGGKKYAWFFFFPPKKKKKKIAWSQVMSHLKLSAVTISLTFLFFVCLIVFSVNSWKILNTKFFIWRTLLKTDQNSSSDVQNNVKKIFKKNLKNYLTDSRSVV